MSLTRGSGGSRVRHGRDGDLPNTDISRTSPLPEMLDVASNDLARTIPSLRAPALWTAVSASQGRAVMAESSGPSR